MSEAKILDTVKKHISVSKKISVNTIQPSSLLKNDLGLDSIVMIMILNSIETELEVSIFDADVNDIQNIKTVNDLVSLINKLKN